VGGWVDILDLVWNVLNRIKYTLET